MILYKVLTWTLLAMMMLNWIRDDALFWAVGELQKHDQSVAQAEANERKACQ